jgi:translocation and assembly module TamB
VQIVSRALRLRGRELGWQDEESTRFDYALTGVRMSVLRPVVRRLFPEIDGRIDGRGSVTLAGDAQTFEGGVAISEGRVYVNLLGEEITNLGAVLYFESNGVFRVQDATGRIGEGDLRASMTGRMKGLLFESANASIVIPSKRGIPLSTEGATYAEATGRADLRLVMSPDRGTLLCAVDVPSARLQLPDRRTQKLQPTGDDATIAIGKRAAKGELVPVQLHQRGARGAAGAAGPAGTGGTPPAERNLATRFTVGVGRDVIIEGRGMRISATGLVLVDVGDEIGVTGRIDLTEGTIDVQGRRFTLDRGTLTFLEGERLDNPTLLASAYWDAPDGARVWAEFADPLATGKLSLRSEPPYTYNEILSLLVFGRPEANVASTGGGGVAGNVVAPGLNRALEELSGGEFEVKANVGSTRVADQTRPEVTVRRGRLGVTVGYVVGPTSTIQPDRTLVTVDWQFLPRWSVAATGGDAYTTILDVLYRYRY